MNLLTFYPLIWHYNKYENILLSKGLTDNDDKIIVKIRLGSTTLLTAVDSVNPIELDEIKNNYVASSSSISLVSNRTVIVRDAIINSRDNWVSIESDPYGKVTSFFQHNKISPYEPFSINLGDDATMHGIAVLESAAIQENAVFNINERQIIKSKKLLHSRTKLRRIFWDIEVVTPRKEFVYAKYIDNHIISISLILQNENEITSYFLYWGSHEVKNTSFMSIRFSREREVLEEFFNIVNKFQPDRMYTFNGDSFDTPYLIERCSLHNIVPKNFKFVSKRIKGRFQWERVMVFDTPEIEHFDILRIMLKFYPGLPNYRLETIGRLFIGEGKTGLDIEEMFKSFYSQSESGMEALAMYSVKDSLLLMQLNEKMNFDELLERVSNSCGMINSEILDSSDQMLVDRCAFMADPGSFDLSGEIIKNNFFTNIKLNTIYKDVHIYDYSIYYSIEMQRYENKFNYDISIRSVDLPAKVKSNLYWSKYFIRGQDESYLDVLLKENKNIVEMTDVNMKSVGPVNDLLDGSLVLLNIYTHYLQLAKVSFAARNIEGNIIKVGTSKVLKPTFKMAADYLEEVLNYLFDQLENIPDYDIFEGDLEDYLIESKLKDIDEYPVGSDKYTLALQFNQRISTWTRVKYYMTTSGPILKDLYDEEELNTDFYEKELLSIKKLLKYKK